MGIFESEEFKQFREKFNKDCKKSNLKKLFKCFEAEKINNNYCYRLKDAEKLDEELEKLRCKYSKEEDKEYDIDLKYYHYIDSIFGKDCQNNDGIIELYIKECTNYHDKLNLGNICSFYQQIRILREKGYFCLEETYAYGKKEIRRNGKDLIYNCISEGISKGRIKKLVETVLKKTNAYNEVLKKIKKYQLSLKEYLDSCYKCQLEKIIKSADKNIDEKKSSYYTNVKYYEKCFTDLYKSYNPDRSKFKEAIDKSEINEILEFEQFKIKIKKQKLEIEISELKEIKEKFKEKIKEEFEKEIKEIEEKINKIEEIKIGTDEPRIIKEEFEKEIEEKTSRVLEIEIKIKKLRLKAQLEELKTIKKDNGNLKLETQNIDKKKLKEEIKKLNLKLKEKYKKDNQKTETKIQKLHSELQEKHIKETQKAETEIKKLEINKVRLKDYCEIINKFNEIMNSNHVSLN